MTHFAIMVEDRFGGMPPATVEIVTVPGEDQKILSQNTVYTTHSSFSVGTNIESDFRVRLDLEGDGERVGIRIDNTDHILDIIHVRFSVLPWVGDPPRKINLWPRSADREEILQMLEHTTGSSTETFIINAGLKSYEHIVKEISYFHVGGVFFIQPLMTTDENTDVTGSGDPRSGLVPGIRFLRHVHKSGIANFDPRAYLETQTTMKSIRPWLNIRATPANLGFYCRGPANSTLVLMVVFERLKSARTAETSLLKELMRE